jgi:hypothetical protein
MAFYTFSGAHVDHMVVIGENFVMEETRAQQDEAIFMACLEIVKRLEACLPEKVEAAKTSWKAKLPFLTASLRECLLYRVAELGLSSCNVIKVGQRVSAAVLIRALLEAVALLVLLDQRVKEAVEIGKIEELNRLVKSGLVGSKNNMTPIEAHNVLTLLKHVTKRYDGFKTLYLDLSEIAHPNWGGLLGAYGKLNEAERSYKLEKSKLPLPMLLLPLRAGLGTFLDTYNSMVPYLHKLVDVCDQALEK